MDRHVLIGVFRTSWVKYHTYNIWIKTHDKRRKRKKCNYEHHESSLYDVSSYLNFKKFFHIPHIRLFYKHLCYRLNNYLIKATPFLKIFKTSLDPNRKRFWDNVYPKPGVTCQVSGIRSHVSCVIFNLLIFEFYNFFCWQNGVPNWWGVCYERGLPRLV